MAKFLNKDSESSDNSDSDEKSLKNKNNLLDEDSNDELYKSEEEQADVNVN